MSEGSFPLFIVWFWLYVGRGSFKPAHSIVVVAKNIHTLLLLAEWKLWGSFFLTLDFLVPSIHLGSMWETFAIIDCLATQEITLPKLEKSRWCTPMQKQNPSLRNKIKSELSESTVISKLFSTTASMSHHWTFLRVFIKLISKSSASESSALDWF